MNFKFHEDFLSIDLTIVFLQQCNSFLAVIPFKKSYNYRFSFYFSSPTVEYRERKTHSTICEYKLLATTGNA